MKNFKIIISLALIIFLILGGKPRNNLRDLSVVEGIGIDYESGEYTATVQSLNLSKEGSGAEALSGNVTMNNTGKGKNIAAAVDDVSKSISKKQFFGQSRVMIFGMNIAQSSLESSLDYFLRSIDSRSDVCVAVSSQKASEIIESKENDALVPAQTISSLLSLSEKSGFGAYVTTNDLLNAYADKTSDIYLPVLSAENDAVKVIGIAVYSENKLVKILNSEETFGFLFLTNKIDNGLLEFEDENLGEVNAKIISSSTKVSANYENGKVIYKVKIKTKIMLNQVENGALNFLTQKDLKNIQNLANKKIENLCLSAFNTCMANKSDVLRIGDCLAMKSPGAYDLLSDDWHNNLQNCRLQISVNCNLNKISENSETN